MWKFCGKAQFLHSLARIAQNYAEIVPFHKISTPESEIRWNYDISPSDKTEIKSRGLDNNNPVRLRILLDASFQALKRLFVLAFDNANNGNKKLKETVIENIFSKD